MHHRSIYMVALCTDTPFTLSAWIGGCAITTTPTALTWAKFSQINVSSVERLNGDTREATVWHIRWQVFVDLTCSRSQRFASTTSAFQFGFRKLGGALRGRQTLRGGYYPRYPCIYRIAYHGITTWVFSYSGGSSPGIIHLLQTILHIRYSVLDTIPYFHRRE